MVRESDLQTRSNENSVSYDGKSKVCSKPQGVEKVQTCNQATLSLLP